MAELFGVTVPNISYHFKRIFSSGELEPQTVIKEILITAQNGVHRYESYVKCSQGRVRYSFDVVKVDKGVLDNLYDYIENEYEYVETYSKILEDNP